jgi:hypothetical protein
MVGGIAGIRLNKEEQAINHPLRFQPPDDRRVIRPPHPATPVGSPWTQREASSRPLIKSLNLFLPQNKLAKPGDNL